MYSFFLGGEGEIFHEMVQNLLYNLHIDVIFTYDIIHCSGHMKC